MTAVSAPRLAAFTASVLLALGCAGGADSSTAGLSASLATGPAAPAAATAGAASSLYGRIAFDGPLLVVPDGRWTGVEPGDGPARFGFLLDATFVCEVAEALTTPLLVRLVVVPESREHRFLARWDGLRLGDAAWQVAGDLREVTIPAPLLVPGRHRLEIERDFSRSPCGDCTNHDSGFASLGYRAGELAADFAPTDLTRLHAIAALAQQGVVGEGPARRGGALAVGPGRLRETLAAAPGAVLRLEPENLSASPARFSVHGAASVALELGPSERGLLRVPIGAGGSVTLEVDGAAAGLFLWGVPVLEGADAATLPPLVLVTLDTTRRDALGVYGAAFGDTPELDGFAGRATVFDGALTTAPWTLPAHASIFTGLYPSRHRAGVTEDGLAAAEPTLAARLRERGYLTLGFSSGKLSSSLFGLGLGFAAYRDPEGFETPGDRTAAAVEETLGALPRPRPPLFLFVNLFDPHALYAAPAELEARVGVPPLRAALAGLPVWGGVAAGDVAAWRTVIAGDAPATPEALAFVRAAYRAEVALADRAVGRIFAALEAEGLFDPALVIVTADHGELLGERGLFSHSGHLDPEVVEVPLLVKWPGQRHGRRVRAPVSLVDLFPTLLAAAGVAPPPSDGLVLTPSGPEPAHRPALFFEEHAHRIHPLDGPRRLAAHLYGAQRARSRQVVWEGGESCARRDEAGAWAAVACPATPSPPLDRLAVGSGDLPRAGDAPAAGVSAEVRRSLEALGYL